MNVTLYICAECKTVSNQPGPCLGCDRNLTPTEFMPASEALFLFLQAYKLATGASGKPDPLELAISLAPYVIPTPPGWEQKHCCWVCKSNKVRLYRYSGSFSVVEEEIFCKAHAPDDNDKELLIPLLEDLGGNVWGASSVPDAIARWRALPEGKNQT